MLGIHLLSLDANLVVSPAPQDTQAPAIVPARPRPIGTRLAVARQTLEEGEASRAAARNGR